MPSPPKNPKKPCFFFSKKNHLRRNFPSSDCVQTWHACSLWHSPDLFFTVSWIFAPLPFFFRKKNFVSSKKLSLETSHAPIPFILGMLVHCDIPQVNSSPFLEYLSPSLQFFFLKKIFLPKCHFKCSDFVQTWHASSLWHVWFRRFILILTPPAQKKSYFIEKVNRSYKKAFGKKARPKWRLIRKFWAPNESRSENVSPQMKANRIWCFAPNFRQTLMMILHLKRGGRVSATQSFIHISLFMNIKNVLTWFVIIAIFSLYKTENQKIINFFPWMIEDFTWMYKTINIILNALKSIIFDIKNLRPITSR